METQELLAIIARDEDSRHQFKADVNNASSLGAEMVAFSNGTGGLILIGVNNGDGSRSGLTREDIGRINQVIANAATNNVRPPINPVTENIQLPDGLVIAVHIEQGISKPYMDTQGYVWVKNGSDKRRVTAREELQRMFQEAALIHADETLVSGTSVADIDQEFFDSFFEGEYGERVEEQGVSRSQLLENMNLAKNGQLNICGTLLFASRPQIRLPVFIVKAVAFPGVDIEDEHYIDSQDINGKLSDVFQKVLGFVLANIRHIQNKQSFNSLGEPEIPRIVLEELISNALIHRDYFVSAPVKVLVFADRIEIISPGHLPNNLTIENIKMGNSNIRNPILASFASKVLPYRGLGSGIKRAIKAYPDIELIDNREGNTFKAIISRMLLNE
ncbi:ATP-dependent DNA helicase RecG [Photorhabdus laumondii subsp. laumondii]|uniref:ATP-dependent DNA helicase RecG n=1 Tax=Photorhabdus laumondii subsp. laumondii TaxID=141679 RepID=A0A6L9JPD1_PHOLM|nr:MULTISPECIES: RNA-binding domain-containing protein [Photorhabdus]AWK40352.1 ATP-dependent DNA helicase RecG [Photorhabdus laumondii subsp. laumondii]AXG41165.1 ATP-dependent DNA helicase RecG [Photorhabdus laumondii subsp. laumondii]AXG45693.1 ATP-dependent DNA helicase RecG [Photorhabdus laumondii subsp. laumondii]MCC8383457.1 putative DNA binding domain-containing protein [Photorhabdus laumondii]MCC8388629.1 putative DNA binding domain-containing protein [Photorhabdus laumondii]